MAYIIGIDIGTTNTKAVAVTDQGEVLADASATYAATVDESGAHELEVEVLFAAVTRMVNKVVEEAGAAGLTGISFSCAMHSFLAVDAAGRPLMRAMTWADLRARQYAEALKKTELGARIYHQTGTPIAPMSPLCKLLWLREHRPEIFRNAAKFISIKEYIWWRLFGKYEVDQGIASATGLYDIYQFKWNKESLELAGIREDQLSQALPGTHFETGPAGDAGFTGIPGDVPFIIGGSDGVLANLGSKAVEPGETALTIGTSGAIRMTTTRPAQDPGARIFQYILTDQLYVCGGPSNNGGGVLQWYVEQFGGDRSVGELTDAAGEIPPGAEGLVFLPYLFGERAPIWNADARGVFFGIRSAHERAHFTRAVLEGITFGLYQTGASLEETIGPIKHIYASGGFTRSRVWLQLVADVFGRTVYTTSGADASAAGAAIFGFYALGLISSPQEAERMIRVQESFLPDAQRHEQYRRSYTMFTELYKRLKDLM